MKVIEQATYLSKIIANEAYKIITKTSNNVLLLNDMCCELIIRRASFYVVPNQLLMAIDTIRVNYQTIKTLHQPSMQSTSTMKIRMKQ